MVPDMGLLGSMCVVRLLSKRIFTRRTAPLPDFSIILKKKKVVLISQAESGCVFFAFAFFQLFARESICIPFPSNYSFCFVNHSHSLPHLLTFNVFKKCLLAFLYTAPLNPFWSFYTYFFPKYKVPVSAHTDLSAQFYLYRMCFFHFQLIMRIRGVSVSAHTDRLRLDVVLPTQRLTGRLEGQRLAGRH